MSPSEIEAGKLMAMVAHGGNIVLLPLFLIPLIMKENRYAVFHAKQGAAGWGVAVSLAVIMSTVSGVMAFIPFVGFLACLTGPLGCVAPIAVGAYGLYLASEGKQERFPVVGDLAANLLKSVQAPKQLNP